MTIGAVLDTSSLFSARLRHALHEAAHRGEFTAIWSPWIVAELNRALVWRWIDSTGGDLSRANRVRSAQAAQRMMEILLPTFELVAPLPPYPPTRPELRDRSDHPIWAAAKLAGAGFVVSGNRREFPPPGHDGRHSFQGIEYLPADAFLSLLRRGMAGSG